MLSCKEATKLVSQGMDRDLPFGRRVQLRVHLAICEGCSNFSKQLALVRQALREFGTKSS